MLPKKAGLQTFLHSQAPSQEITQWRDLARTKPNAFVLCRAQTLSSEAQWRLCLGAITEFTAAGQSGILTQFTTWTFSRLSKVQINLPLHSAYENVPN